MVLEEEKVVVEPEEDHMVVVQDQLVLHQSYCLVG